MKLNDLVSSYELSLKLRELGIPQESLFCYQLSTDSGPTVWPRSFDLVEFRNSSSDERIAAFTVAELGKLLPFTLDPFYGSKDLGDLHLCKNASDIWICNYISQRTGSGMPWMEDANEANSRAKMLVHLIENKLMEIPK